MQPGRQVTHEVDVVGPGKVLRVLRTAYDKAILKPDSGRFDEQLDQRGLPVRSIGTEIAETASELLHWLCGTVDLRIDPAVERCNALRAQAALQLIKRPPPGIAEHEIKISKSVF